MPAILPRITPAREAHLALHPFGRMPVLDHDSFRLYETQAILRYVADAFPGEPLVTVSCIQRSRWLLMPARTRRL
jgi:glutathione S-transferase